MRIMPTQTVETKALRPMRMGMLTQTVETKALRPTRMGIPTQTKAMTPSGYIQAEILSVECMGQGLEYGFVHEILLSHIVVLRRLFLWGHHTVGHRMGEK